MQVNIRRAGASLILSVALVPLVVSRAHASLPVFGGVGEVDGILSAAFNPSIINFDHRLVNNAGVAIARANKDNDANTSVGTRAYRWAPRVAAQQLGTLLPDTTAGDTEP